MSVWGQRYILGIMGIMWHVRVSDVTGGHVLSIYHGDGEVGVGVDDLAGLVEGGLGGALVEEGGDGLT